MKRIIYTIIGLILYNFAYSYDIIGIVNWYPGTMPSFTGNLVIKNGATLTIHPGCTLTMSSNSNIVVEKNAKLVIDNSLITGNGSWEGIRCNKGIGAMLPTDKIPYVNIKNYSEINSANIAFANYYTDISNNSYYGGSIIASDVNFFNNYKFLDIKNHVYGPQSFNQCQFLRCKFKEMLTCHISVKFIEIENTKNVYFKGCEFYYGCTSPRTAVMIRDSKVSIDRYYNFITGQEIKSTFKGFSVPVSVVNIAQNGEIVNISNCVFNTRDPQELGDNLTCISILNGNNPQILNNTFNIYQGNYPWGTGGIVDRVAISLSDCPTFYIEGNTINFNGVNQDTRGIYIYNSGIATNLVYNNVIDNATIGVQADGTNRGNIYNPNLPNLGLKFLCNQFNNFSNTSYYIKATNCNNSTFNYGVSRWQQGALNDANGNVIAGSPSFNTTPDRQLQLGTADNDFYDEHITLNTFDIQYVHPSCPGDYTVRYVSKDSYGNNLVSTTEDPLTSAASPHCESRLPCTGPNCPVVMSPFQITVSFPQYSGIKQQLSELVNDGDYTYLYNLVENVNSSNVNDVYYELLNSNPSHDILMLACANDLFTPSMIEQILVENSYGIKSSGVRNTLQERETQLSEVQMDNIYTAAENISEYEALMMDIDAINQEYTNLMNQSIGALESRDSIPMDSVKMYLEAFNDLWSNIRLIHFALEENNFTYAQQKFENLGNISNETGEISDYSTLYNNVFVDIYTNHEGDFYQMTESQKNDLYDIFTNGNYAAGIAKYLLMKYDDLEWVPNYCEGGSIDERKANPKIMPETSNQMIAIYPNPANDILNIVLADEFISPAELTILDLSGRIVKILMIKSQNSQINISDLSEGVYLVKIFVNDEILTDKLIITK